MDSVEMSHGLYGSEIPSTKMGSVEMSYGLYGSEMLKVLVK
jgi:hypothetical protein